MNAIKAFFTIIGIIFSLIILVIAYVFLNNLFKELFGFDIIILLFILLILFSFFIFLYIRRFGSIFLSFNSKPYLGRNLDLDFKYKLKKKVNVKNLNVEIIVYDTYQDNTLKHNKGYIEKKIDEQIVKMFERKINLKDFNIEINKGSYNEKFSIQLPTKDEVLKQFDKIRFDDDSFSEKGKNFNKKLKSVIKVTENILRFNPKYIKITVNLVLDKVIISDSKKLNLENENLIINN